LTGFTRFTRFTRFTGLESLESGWRVEKLSEKSEKSGESGEQELTEGREENEIGRARGSEVPQGGTAKVMLYRLRVYTVLPFCFSCGEVHRALNAASFLAD